MTLTSPIDRFGVRFRLGFARSIRCVVFGALCALFIGETSSAALRPMSIDDLYKFKSVSALALSPDGSQVAFLVSVPRDRLDVQEQELWMLDIATRMQSRIATGRSIYTLGWSPDNRTLSYFRLEDEGQQLHLYDLKSRTGRVMSASGEKGGREPLEIFSCQWGPSSEQLACIVRPRSQETVATGASQAAKVLIMGVSPELSMMRGRYLHQDYFLALVDVATGHSRPITRPPVRPSLTATSMDWSSDGKSLVFIGYDKPLNQTHDFLREASVFSADIDSGVLKNLGGSAGADSEPLWSARESGVYFYGNESRDVYVRGGGAIRRLDASSGEMTVVLEGRVAGLQADKSRSHLIFTRRTHANEQLYRLSTRSGRLTRLSPLQATVVDFSVAKNNDSVAMILSSPSEPPEIHVGSIASGKFRKVTDLYADERSKFVFSQAEQLSWPSRDGRFMIDGFLLKPHDFDPSKKYPLLVNLHGGPSGFVGTFHDVRLSAGHHSQMEFFANNGYVVLMPNYRGGDFNDAPGFSEGLRGKPTVSFDLDIEAGVDHLLKRGFVDGKRMALLGASYGGYLAAQGASRTDRYRAISINDSPFDMTSFYGQGYPEFVDFSNYYLGGSPRQFPETYRSESPISHVNRIRTPILLRAGNYDGKHRPYLFHSQSLEFYAALRDEGIPVELIVHPFEGHGVADVETSKDYLIRNAEWLGFWLSGTEDPAPEKLDQYERWRSMREQFAMRLSSRGD